MIIFGTRGIKNTKYSGHFNCPICKSKQSFNHRNVKRFFTLFFIPVIPLGSAGEYIECKVCTGTFDTRVLQQSSAQDRLRANYQKAIIHSMVLMMLADGMVDEREKEIIKETIRKHAKTDVSESRLTEIINDARNQDIRAYLGKMSNSLNAEEKEAILNAAISVAKADGIIDQSEVELLRKMGESLEMLPSHLNGVLNQLNIYAEG